MNINKYLLSESKTSVSPYLKSMIKHTDKITNDEVASLQSSLDMVSSKNVSFKVTMMNKTKKPAISTTIKVGDNYDEKVILNAINKAGFKFVGDETVDGNVVFVIKRK